MGENMTVNLNVGGVNRSYSFEYTSSNTSFIYQNLLNQLQALGNSTGTFTAADLNNFNNTMLGLKAMLTGQSAGPNGNLFFLDSPITGQMAQGIISLLELNKSLNLNVELDPSFLTTTTAGLGDINQLTQWRDLYNLGLNTTIHAVQVGASGASTTLQALVQLEYVQNGNNQIYNQLSSLNQAMTATQQALTLLENLQLVKNRATVIQNITTALSAWGAGTPIGNPLAQNQPSIVSLLLAITKVGTNSAKFLPGIYRNTTTGEVGQLKITSDATFASDLISQGPALITQLQQTISSLSILIPSGTNPPSLVDQLTTILNDIQTGQPGVANQTIQQKFAWWLLDNYNNGAASVSVPGIGTMSNFSNINSGNYQRDLISATTSAQTLNSSQNTQLQQTVFIFQEFYKSASDILQSINNILTQMGQGEAA